MENYYYIITKIENINGNITYTNIGYYVLSKTDANTINQNYISYNNWIEANKTDLENSIKLISEYFTSNPIVYNNLETTTCIDNFNLSLILDIQNL